MAYALNYFFKNQVMTADVLTFLPIYIYILDGNVNRDK